MKGIRSAAAAAHGLPAELHEFLTAEDETGALAQAEKLAASLSAGTDGKPDNRKPPALPPAGGRNPANGGEQAARLEEQHRFETLRQKVPALNSRVLRH